jgi:cellulose synthase/poly-beta-1,6-N-acetylglucosamine synthase-like glycosyltransferase
MKPVDPQAGRVAADRSRGTPLSPVPPHAGLARFPLAVVILARDESEVLGETLLRLREAVAACDEIHVVADHCRDRTAEIARSLGAVVHVRSGGTPLGKGAALGWWLERTRRSPRRPEAVVVLDADSLVGWETLGVIRRALSGGAVAVQAYVHPLLRSETALGRLAALSEIVEQQIYDSLRSRLGWPVRLRGTGMGFLRPALEGLASRLQTSAEDIELTVLLAAQGVRVVWLKDAVVLDPKPPDEVGATRQRARWLRGLLEVALACRGQLLHVVALGPPGWSLLSSLMLKPRSLYFPLKVLLTASAWALAAGGSAAWRLLAWALALSTGAEAAGWVAGLGYAPAPRETLRALLQAPKFALMWIRSASLLRMARHSWLRARPMPPEPVQGEASAK